MSAARASGGALLIWRVLLLAQLRESPVRLLVTVLAIALGVALGAAVYLVNSAALNEFGLATKRLVGEADVIVRGPREGFSEQLFTRLARDAAVSEVANRGAPRVGSCRRICRCNSCRPGPGSSPSSPTPRSTSSPRPATAVAPTG